MSRVPPISPRRGGGARWRWALGAAAPVALFAGVCSQPSEAEPIDTTTINVPDTVGLTDLPEPITLTPTLPVPASIAPPPSSTSSSTSSTSLGPPPTVAYRLTEGAVAGAVDGNRVLMIGDSVLASTAERFGGPMCATIQSYGWAAQIEAEEARHIEFAARVLDELLPATGETAATTSSTVGDDRGVDDVDDDDFDVVMVMLGNNYRGAIDDFRSEYDALLRRLSPRPVVVYTVSENEPVKAQVNDVIRDLADGHDNVLLIDWAEKTADDPDALLAADDLHLSDEGRDRLSLFTVAALGQTTAGQPDCLDPVFTDDSGT